MSASPSDLLDRAQGQSLTSLAQQGVGAWLLAVSVSVITGIQEVTNLLITTPVDVLTNIIEQSAAAFILEPLGIVTTGADASSQAVTEFGLFGLIIGVAVVLGAFFLVGRFVGLEATSNVLPGVIADNFIIGTDEGEARDE